MFQEPEEVFSDAMESISSEQCCGMQVTVAHVAISTVGHLGRIPLVTGFSGVGDPILQQRFVDSAAPCVFLSTSSHIK